MVICMVIFSDDYPGPMLLEYGFMTCKWDLYGFVICHEFHLTYNDDTPHEVCHEMLLWYITIHFWYIIVIFFFQYIV